LGSPTTQPGTAATSAPPRTQQPTNTHISTILLVVVGAIVLVILALLVLRQFGRPRSEPRTSRRAKTGTDATAFNERLRGAAAHRRSAALAAECGEWAEAIRERFRAIIAALDERGLLPERTDRTAGEAARDAGYVLPAHATALNTAARSFDEVEYGEQLGSPDGYAVISAVDDQVSSVQPGVPGVPGMPGVGTASTGRRGSR
jgi:hypothetical protein